MAESVTVKGTIQPRELEVITNLIEGTYLAIFESDGRLAANILISAEDWAKIKTHA